MNARTALAHEESRVRFLVRVQPRASRSEIAGMHGNAIKIRLTSPPVDDAANEELIALLARELGISRAAVRIVPGARARSKVVEVVGATIDRVMQLATKEIAR